MHSFSEMFVRSGSIEVPVKTGIRLSPAMKLTLQPSCVHFRLGMGDVGPQMVVEPGSE